MHCYFARRHLDEIHVFAVLIATDCYLSLVNTNWGGQVSVPVKPLRLWPPLDLHFIDESLRFRQSLWGVTPRIDNAYTRCIAHPNSRVGTITDSGFQSSSKTGDVGCVQEAVSYIEIRVNEIVVPSLLPGWNVLLHHGVRRVVTDVGAGEDIHWAGRIVRGERHLMRRGENGDLVGLGNTARPYEIRHHDSGRSVLDVLP